MNFNEHLELEGRHAFLSASSPHWVNYDLEKLSNRYITAMAAARGTRIHEWACETIELGFKMPRSKKTLNMYVNDAIGYKMSTEQILYYSENCFGTADCISFRKNFLRIHDLKTGTSKASMKQLEVYEALFCLEYGHNPEEINAELRIYQSDEILVHEPDPTEIRRIMNKIVDSDKHIERLRMEE